jgi:2-succinyl-5-enolpyruvyl-6-hydroxy-3-cyclohexene-1-carboxylate synthase
VAPASETEGARGAANARAALVLLGALAQRGLRHLVLCPGSRSAPLAVAASLLESHGVRLHTAIDERSAAFFALGLGRAEGLPAAVITTSGTAVANLLPAAVEADHGTIPLLLLSADRPARLKGCGANQSVNQEAFLACSSRWTGQGDPRGLAAMAEAELLDLARRAMEATLGDGDTLPPGPVHLNLPFDEPLHATGAEIEALVRLLPLQPPHQPPERRPEAIPVPTQVPPALAGPARLDPERPGVVVAGPWRGPAGTWQGHVTALRRWQRRSGWPVLADALSGLRGLADLELVAGYDLLLETPPPGLAAPQVLRLGSLPASRRLQQWLLLQAGPQVLVSEADPRRLDPLGRVRAQWSGGLASWLAAVEEAGAAAAAAAAVPGSPAIASDRDLARHWLAAEREVQALLDHQLGALPGDGVVSEPWLARRLGSLLPAGLPVMLANSSPVRDWETFADPAAPARPVYAFRGASGIDGTLSIACGLAESLGELVLVSGDLALLHDANGWLWRRQLRGRLTVVLIDNGGGGIFEQLPIRTEPAVALAFDRLFAMPQGVDACALATLHGVPARRLEAPDQLAQLLAWALSQPMALLEVPTRRRADADLRRRLRTMAARSTPPDAPP